MANRDLIFTVLGIDKASRTFDQVGRSMDRMSTRATKALGGITGTAAASSAAIATAVGGASAAFIGLGAVALRNNAEVRKSFQDLSNTINEGLAQDAAPLKDAFVGAAEDIGDSYAKLRPEMRQAFAASAPHVATLTSGVTGFAEQAMPGMVSAVESADPVMQGFRSLMIDAGAGTREFFEIVSQGSEEAGQGIQHFGQLAMDGLPEIGGILANLNSLWAEHGDEVVDVVTRMLGVINDLSGSALPVLSAGIGTAMNVLSGLLNVIEPLAGAIGPLIGLWVSLGTAMKGMRAVSGIMGNAAGAVTNFGDATRRAAGTKGVGRFRGAARGVMGMLGGPWGLAVAGATAILGAFAQRSQETASKQRSLARTLRDSGGAFNAQAREILASGKEYQEAAGFVNELGISQREFIDTVIQGGPPLDNLKQRIQAMGDSGQLTIDQMGALFGAIREIGTVAGGASEKYRTLEKAAKGVGETMMGSVPGADALTEAMNTLSNETATTSDRVDALNTAWKQLFGIEISLEEATANWEGSLASLREKLTKVKGGTDNWRSALFNADGQIDVTTEAGRKLSEQLITQGEDYRRLAQTVFDTTLKRTGSEQRATQAVIAATGKRRSQFISEMTQMGFNESQARQLANRYLGMPNDILTQIRADANQALGEIAGLRVQISRVPRHINITTRFTQSGNPGVNRLFSSTGADGGMVTGGDIVPGFAPGGMVRGPGGPRDDVVPALLSNGEFVVNAKATRQYGDLLRAINSGRMSSGDAQAVMSSGGSRGGGSPTVTVRFDTTGADEGMKQVIRKMVRVDGNGDVRVAFEP